MSASIPNVLMTSRSVACRTTCRATETMKEARTSCVLLSPRPASTMLSTWTMTWLTWKMKPLPGRFPSNFKGDPTASARWTVAGFHHEHMMRRPSSDTLMDDVSVVRALKAYFISHPIQIQCTVLMIHDYPKLKTTDDSQIRKSLCNNVHMYSYTNWYLYVLSMIMNFCIWADDDSQFRILAWHVRVRSHSSWCMYVYSDDNDVLHLIRTMILNFDYLYGTFTGTVW